jgi:hypothetical protein
MDEDVDEVEADDIEEHVNALKLFQLKIDHLDL